MTKAEKKLLNSSGRTFQALASVVRYEAFHLADYAVKALPNGEWTPCGDALEVFMIELDKAVELVSDRMREAGILAK